METRTPLFKIGDRVSVVTSINEPHPTVIEVATVASISNRKATLSNFEPILSTRYDVFTGRGFSRGVGTSYIRPFKSGDDVRANKTQLLHKLNSASYDHFPVETLEKIIGILTEKGVKF